MEKQWKQWQTLFSWAPNHCRWCSHEIKRHLNYWRKAITNIDSIVKSRDITLPTKAHLVKAIVFPLVMYGCESWILKKVEHRWIHSFKFWCCWRLSRVAWTARRSYQSILKEFSPEYLMMLNLKLQYLANWCEELTPWKRHSCGGKLKAGGEEENRGGDGWMVTLTQWVWVWASSGSWWWTGKPSVL